MLRTYFQLRPFYQVSPHLNKSYFVCHLLRYFLPANPQRMLRISSDFECYFFVDLFFADKRSGFRLSPWYKIRFFVPENVKFHFFFFGFPVVRLKLASVVVVIGRFQPIWIIFADFAILAYLYAGWTKYYFL